MKEIYIKAIAGMLEVKDWQVENCAELFEEGATIPFVSRYRKERTGGLDEVSVAEIRHWVDVFAEMEKRKSTVLETIEQAGALTPELRYKIENTVDSRELEDLYLPYKPKRRTRATAAKEAGLEPLADKMYSVSLADPSVEARKYLNRCHRIHHGQSHHQQGHQRGARRCYRPGSAAQLQHRRLQLLPQPPF